MLLSNWNVSLETLRFTTLLSLTPKPQPFGYAPVHNFNLGVRKILDGESTT